MGHERQQARGSPLQRPTSAWAGTAAHPKESAAQPKRTASASQTGFYGSPCLAERGNAMLQQPRGEDGPGSQLDNIDL